MAWTRRVAAVSESRPGQGPRVELGTVTQGSGENLGHLDRGGGGLRMALGTGQERGMVAVAIVRVISVSLGGRPPSMLTQSAPGRGARYRNPPFTHSPLTLT